MATPGHAGPHRPHGPRRPHRATQATQGYTGPHRAATKGHTGHTGPQRATQGHVGHTGHWSPMHGPPYLPLTSSRSLLSGLGQLSLPVPSLVIYIWDYPMIGDNKSGIIHLGLCIWDYPMMGGCCTWDHIGRTGQAWGPGPPWSTCLVPHLAHLPGAHLAWGFLAHWPGSPWLTGPGPSPVWSTGLSWSGLGLGRRDLPVICDRCDFL